MKALVVLLILVAVAVLLFVFAAWCLCVYRAFALAETNPDTALVYAVVAVAMGLSGVSGAISARRGE